MRKKVAIIGGGASGMMAAITATKEGALVTVYEGNDRLGKKLLVTGNGKCNLGNEKLSVSEYHGGDMELIASCLKRFGTEDTKRFFQSLGLMLKEKNGYLYPACEQASVVLDVLRSALEEYGVEIVSQAKVTDIKQLKNGQFELLWETGRAVHDSVVLACGSKAAPKTGSDGTGYRLAGKLGLEQKTVVPALTALRCREEYCKALAGVRADAEVRILAEKQLVLKERGELQLVDYGISGIPVFQLSGQVNYLLKEGKAVDALIDFLPDLSGEEYEEFIHRRLQDAGNRTVEVFFTGMLHKKIMMLLIKLAGLKPNVLMREADRSKVLTVFQLCKELPFHVTGSNPFDQAQVCAGGVKLSEVTMQLEAKRVPGIFLAGELLDVDGRCGGYNLQWAWSSGYIAGKAAAGKSAAARKAIVGKKIAE